MLIYLVCYDIQDDELRRDLSNTLERHGRRVQESVFELAFDTPAERERLRVELMRLVGLEARGVRFYRLCSNCRAASFDLDGGEVAGFGGTVIL